MYNGIINVYKEKGYTSFDVVARMRGDLWTEENRSYRDVRSGCGRRAASLPWKSNESL